MNVQGQESITGLFLSAVLSSAVVNAIVSHLLYHFKVRKDQKSRAQNVVWDKIAEAIDAIREEELKAGTIEVLDAESTFSEGDFDIISDPHSVAYYPGIMAGYEEFVGYGMRFSELRAEYGKYLDPKVNSYLLYMERYVMQAAVYIKNNYPLRCVPLVGSVLMGDIQLWQKRFEKLLVKRINHPKHKVYAEDGRKWERAKEKTKTQLWERSVLKKLMEDDQNDELARMAKEILLPYRLENTDVIEITQP